MTLLNEHNRTTLNMTRTFTVRGQRMRFAVISGAISIKGRAVSRIVMGRWQDLYKYYSPVTGKEISEYKGLTPKQFLVKLIEEGKVNM
jgi:hypothetical protein